MPNAATVAGCCEQRRKTTINRNLITKKQAEGSELGYEETRKRDEKTRYTKFLFSPALPVSCCVLSGSRVFAKMAQDMYLRNKAQTYIRASPGTWGRERCVLCAIVDRTGAASVFATTDVSHDFCEQFSSILGLCWTTSVLSVWGQLIFFLF